MTQITGIIGSMRKHSRTALVVQTILEIARKAGAETSLIDLRTTQLPLFNPDIKEKNTEVVTISQQLLQSDAIVIGSPDYHGSMSGVMKNFLDHYWHEFAGRLFGIVCASHEKGLTAIDQIQTVMRQCYAWTLPYGIGFDPHASFDQEGKLNDERLEKRIEMMAHDLMCYGPLIQTQFQSELQGDPIPGFASHYRSK